MSMDGAARDPYLINQRLQGITSVIQAMLLGSCWIAPPLFCIGTTSKSALTD
jgi:hypothetical protein